MGDNKRKRSNKSGTKPPPPAAAAPSSDDDAPKQRALRSSKASRVPSDHPSVSASIRVVPAMEAVVKVFCVHTEPNFSLPWQRKRQYSSNSSGFVICGRRVLTNAHSVEHFTQVKVKRRGSDVKYLARVLAVGTECDIG
ncbi:hypothetical protein MLD38_012546 [Melastoma candidum]|uniref:Uncharacterized protein n=1 Tax=Melastoma candidum TaxID=119954 RepID=A0ACB9R6S5_9MYRT|nr:hypothetical protein MLD38_012546 [Melastoma candidum]